MASGTVIFVRETDDSRFLNREGKWVLSLDDAATFGNTLEAREFCRKRAVHAAEIVMRIGKPIYDVTLSVR